MLGHLQFLLESERGEDLSLRRFSPLEYSFKLSGPVVSIWRLRFPSRPWKNNDKPSAGGAPPCLESARYHQRRPIYALALRSEACQKAFPTWDGCHKHMQSHNKPLACPVCESYGTDQMPRLRKHLKDVHGQKNTGSGHFSRKSGSKFLAK